MNYGKNNYHSKNLLKKNKIINIHTEGGTKKSIKASIVGKSKYLINDKEKAYFKTNIHYHFPVKENDKIGTVDVYIDNKKIQTRNILAKESVEAYDLKYCFNKVFSWFLLQ